MAHLHHNEFLMSPLGGDVGIRGTTSMGAPNPHDFDNIWTYNTNECDFMNQYTDSDLQPGNVHSDLEFDTPDLSLLDPMVMKYENDVIQSPDHDAMMAPDSQTHVSTTAPSPYADVNQQMSPLSLQTFSSSSPTVPSSTPYSGDYEFAVSVQKQPKETKSATWTHSETLSKLYARIGVAIPFVYRCGSGGSRSGSSTAPSSGGVQHPPHGTVLRVLPVYIRPEHVRDVVRRCPNHAAEAVNVNGRPSGNKQTQSPSEAQHLIRSQHSKAKYVEDTCSHRLSVIIPYENPQAGADWVTTLLEFHCFSSCVGGLNRRPVQLIFTLESPEGTVLGRQAIEVRVCACPGRDRAGDERSALAGLPEGSLSNGVHSGDGDSRRPGGGVGAGRSTGAGGGASKRAAATTLVESKLSLELAAKRPRDEMDGDVFTLKIRGRRNYDILSTLRDCLELSSMLPPQLADQYRAKQFELGQRLTAFDQSPTPTNMTSNGKSAKNKPAHAQTTGAAAGSGSSIRANAVPTSSMIYQLSNQLVGTSGAIYYQ